MTRERFLQIAAEEGLLNAESSWEIRPFWAEAADDEEIRALILLAVEVSKVIQANARAERN